MYSLSNFEETDAIRAAIFLDHYSRNFKENFPDGQVFFIPKSPLYRAFATFVVSKRYNSLYPDNFLEKIESEGIIKSVYHEGLNILQIDLTTKGKSILKDLESKNLNWLKNLRNRYKLYIIKSAEQQEEKSRTSLESVHYDWDTVALEGPI